MRYDLLRTWISVNKIYVKITTNRKKKQKTINFKFKTNNWIASHHCVFGEDVVVVISRTHWMHFLSFSRWSSLLVVHKIGKSPFFRLISFAFYFIFLCFSTFSLRSLNKIYNKLVFGVLMGFVSVIFYFYLFQMSEEKLEPNINSWEWFYTFLFILFIIIKFEKDVKSRRENARAIFPWLSHSVMHTMLDCGLRFAMRMKRYVYIFIHICSSCGSNHGYNRSENENRSLTGVILLYLIIREDLSY